MGSGSPCWKVRILRSRGSGSHQEFQLHNFRISPLEGQDSQIHRFRVSLLEGQDSQIHRFRIFLLEGLDSQTHKLRFLPGFSDPQGQVFPAGRTGFSDPQVQVLTKTFRSKSSGYPSRKDRILRSRGSGCHQDSQLHKFRIFLLEGQDSQIHKFRIFLLEGQDSQIHKFRILLLEGQDSQIHKFRFWPGLSDPQVEDIPAGRAGFSDPQVQVLLLRGHGFQIHKFRFHLYKAMATRSTSSGSTLYKAMATDHKFRFHLIQGQGYQIQGLGYQI